jgi:ABC-type Fe3+ transport system substrate-binding protein
MNVGSGTESQVRWMLSEFKRKPEGIDVDVFFGGGIDPYETLAKEGLLAPHRVPNLDEVPVKLLGVPLYDPEHRWYGCVLSSFGIFYNRQILDRLGVPEPTTWEDMCDPRLAGYVGLADPTQSGSARAIYEIILQAYGWERGMSVLTRMAANARDFYDGSSRVVTDVAKGEIAMGPAIDFYAYIQRAQTGPDKVDFVLPEGLTVITPDTIAVIKGAPHAENARHFVDFVMSEAGQKLWMLRAGQPGGPEKHNLLRMSVTPAFYEKYAGRTGVTMNPFRFKGSFPHDAAKGSARREVVGQLMRAVMLDPQKELRAAWDAVKSRPPDDPLVREMTRPPVSEAEAMELAHGKWENDAFRQETISAWYNDTLARYRRIRERAAR